MTGQPPYPPGQPQPPQPGSPPASARPDRPPYPVAEPPREGRSVSFYLAIFLALLLFVSGGLNVLLLLVSALGTATAGLGPAGADDGRYEIVAVGGDKEAEARVLRVPIEGAIAESGSVLLGSSGGVVSEVRRALEYAGREEAVKGVLLAINSPGGGVTDSDVIWKMIVDFKREHEKPIVALFGDLAASGGYYIAAPCDQIIARPTTMTGSIGVIMSSVNFAGAAEKYGIRQDVIVSERTPFKDMLSSFRPMRDDERAVLTSIVDEMYDRFVDIVAEGRGMDRERVVEIADGRVYSAKQALANGLVDQIGDPDDAETVLAELCAAESIRLIERRRLPTLGDLLFGVRAREPSMESSVAQILKQGTGPKLLYYWPGGR